MSSRARANPKHTPSGGVREEIHSPTKSDPRSDQIPASRRDPRAEDAPPASVGPLSQRESFAAVATLKDRIATLELKLKREERLRQDAEEERDLLQAELDRMKKLARQSAPDAVARLEAELAKERELRQDVEEAYRRAREALGAGKTQTLASSSPTPPRRATKAMLTPADERNAGAPRRKTERPPR